MLRFWTKNVPIFQVYFWLSTWKLKMVQKTTKFSKNEKKWKNINFFQKLKQRKCKQGLGGYPKNFWKDFDNIRLLNLSARFLHEKMDHFKTPKKTHVNLKVQNGPKKWSKKRADRFTIQFLIQDTKKVFQSALSTWLKLLCFNFLILCLVCEIF